MSGFSGEYAMVQQDELDRFMKDFNDELNQYSAAGMRKPMQDVMAMIKESHDKFVPEDTQATKDSWYQEITAEGDEVKAVFGNDRNGELDYVPFIYLGLDEGGNPINFNKAGAIPFWLESAFQENLDAINRKLSNPKGKKK